MGYGNTMDGITNVMNMTIETGNRGWERSGIVNWGNKKNTDKN